MLEHPVISQESPMPPPQEPLQRVPVSFCVPRSPVGQGQWKENMRTHQKNDALHHNKSDSKSTPSWYRVTSVIFFDDRQYIILSKTSLARIPEFIKKKKVTCEKWKFYSWPKRWPEIFDWEGVLFPARCCWLENCLEPISHSRLCDFYLVLWQFLNIQRPLRDSSNGY